MNAADEFDAGWVLIAALLRSMDSVAEAAGALQDLANLARENERERLKAAGTVLREAIEVFERIESLAEKDAT